MYGGFGYPTFVFYQPGYFLLTLPLTLVMGLKVACYTSLFLAVFAGTFGAYRLARLWNPAWLSLCLAAVFVLSSKLAHDLYYLGDLPEVYAALMCPWSAYFALTLARAGAAGRSTRWAAAGLAVTTALILVTHPFVAFWWLPFVAGLVAFGTLKQPWGTRTMVTGGCCLAIGVAIAAPYWVPAVSLIPEVATPTAAFELQGKKVTQKLKLTLVELVGDYTSAEGREQLGRHLAAAFGFGLAWRLPALRFAAAMCLLFLYMRSVASVWLWEAFYPVLKFMQNSSRIDRPMMTMLFIGAVQLGRPLAAWQRAGGVRAWAGVAAAGAATAAVVWAMAPTFHLVPPAPESARLKTRDFTRVVGAAAWDSRMTGTGANEFLPRRSRIDPRRPAPRAELVRPADGDSLAVAPGHTPYRIRLDVLLTGSGAVRVNQLYFPGWRVRVDGRDVQWALGRRPGGDPTARLTRDGCIRIDLPTAGSHLVEAWYDGPPGWRVRNAAVAAAVAVLAWVLWRVNGPQVRAAWP
jgi:hypothetical protein